MVEVTMWTEADLTTDASTNTRATTLAVTPKWQYFRTVPGVLRIIEMVNRHVIISSQIGAHF